MGRSCRSHGEMKNVRSNSLTRRDHFRKTSSWNHRHKTKIWCEDVDWIHLAQERVQWRHLVNPVMNLRVPERSGIS
jgi:hypothetical protein